MQTSYLEPPQLRSLSISEIANRERVEKAAIGGVGVGLGEGELLNMRGKLSSNDKKRGRETRPGKSGKAGED